MAIYSFKLTNTCNDLINKCEVLEQSIKSDSWEASYNDSVDLLKRWEKENSVISSMVHHSEVDNMNNELWKLTQYTKFNNKEESLASIHVIKFLLKHIIEMERINITNIL
ncbi:DUF4363 family protein [Clostridium niameyense]|uniref:DUF4363 family protein n=1 Tax=Clostridium niameyense TaxID=1622073 RepID=UPI001969CEF7|nr:DUF4363 family protein [Clostridium niameyense]